MTITLKDSAGSIFGIASSWERANEITKGVFKRNFYSNLYYSIDFGDDQVEGVIDLEPKEFYRRQESKIFTNHIKTFWGNISKLTAPTFPFTQADINFFSRLLTYLK